MLTYTNVCLGIHWYVCLFLKIRAWYMSSSIMYLYTLAFAYILYCACKCMSTYYIVHASVWVCVYVIGVCECYVSVCVCFVFVCVSACVRPMFCVCVCYACVYVICVLYVVCVYVVYFNVCVFVYLCILYVMYVCGVWYVCMWYIMYVCLCVWCMLHVCGVCCVCVVLYVICICAQRPEVAMKYPSCLLALYLLEGLSLNLELTGWLTWLASEL